MRRKILIAALSVVGLLIAAAAYLWWFGTPSSTDGGSSAATAPAAESGSGSASAGAEQAGNPMANIPKPDSDAEAPEADPRSPLAVSVPGCVCHSDDPKVVERHADYRMNQCFGCHK